MVSRRKEDGKKTAVQRDGNTEIYVMDANGTHQTRLTFNPAVDGDPAWRPDGKKIAFSSDRDGSREIYVMNADGSAQTRLTHTTGLSDAISGGSGSDKITGGAGNDRLNGGRGRDSIAGNAGNDTILARDGFSDRVLGGPGVDRAQVDARDRVFDVERRF